MKNKILYLYAFKKNSYKSKKKNKKIKKKWKKR